MPRILVSDALSEQGLARLRAAEGFELDYKPGLKEAALAEAIGDADGLVVRSGSQVTAKVLEHARNLKVIGRAGIGVDNIDVPAASKRGIVVMNTPTGNSVTTAEHTLALMLSLARWVPQASASLKGGKWEKKKFEGRELAGKTLGVVGLGTIGRIVADRARGLQMRVVGFDPVLSAERAASFGVELVTLDTLWAEADVITVHTPLTATTRALVNDAVVPKLRKGVLLVNCARGGIYDEAALLRGLESGHIGGVALDVFVDEPPPEGSPLVRHERVVVTPHLGASTSEAQERVAIEIIDQVLAFLKSGEVKNAVNAPSVPVELAPRLAPWLDLAERLGRFLAQVESVTPRTIEVECQGEPAGLSTAAITAAALGGVLTHFLHVPVNHISAPHIAADRGMAVRELKSSQPAGPYASQVIVRVRGEAGEERVAAGTLGGDRSPRLVRWGDFGIEARLAGTALVVTSKDRPGVIGYLGSALGTAGINVASVFLGKASADDAISLWTLDHVVPAGLVAELRAFPNIARVVAVEL
ncbi:MAG: phosphoglycerate dehydrogenase [Polyangiaceae bacterium]|nr:phosphoglycerate dehydrogenase [Polyangiaceae bacterium]